MYEYFFFIRFVPSNCSQFCLVYVLEWKVERDFKWGVYGNFLAVQGFNEQFRIYTLTNDPSFKLN